MKKVLFIVALLALSSQLTAQTPEYSQILNRYEQWKTAQYQAGKYCTPANCKVDVMLKAGYKGPTIGIPKDISIFYTDINADNKLDALISFNPQQCDGGNAMMNAQENLLILSKAGAYIVDDTYFDKIGSTLKSGWININGAAGGSFYGIYTDYKDDDPRCCPSIKKEFSLDYKSKKLEYQ
jgi:hypothetical protein